VRLGHPVYAPPTKKCPDTGKLCYASKHHVRQARKRLKSSLGGEDLDIYQCKVCWMWHVGNS